MLTGLKLQENQQKCFIAFFVFVLSLMLRVSFAFQWQHMPYGDAPLLDAKVYDDWAIAILNGHPDHHAFYQSPLYPYMLAGLYSLTGHNYLAASLLNACVDSATCVLLCLICFSLFGSMAAIATGLLAAGFAPMIFYTAPPMKESVALFLIAAFLYTSLGVLRSNRLRHYALCGVALGLAVLARGNALFLLPIMPYMAWRQYHRAARHGIFIYGMAVLVAVSPAALYNYVVAADFVPLTYDAGFNLYIGHSPFANGTNGYPPEVSTDPEHERLDTTWIAEQQAGRKLSASAISAFWRDKAIKFALNNPWREVELLGLKLFAFWNGAETFDNYDVRFIKREFPSLLNLPLADFQLVIMLAAFTVLGQRSLSSMRKNNCVILEIYTAFYMASVLIFYVTDRYRLPVVVFLLPLAGAAFPCAYLLWRQKNYSRLLVSAACMFPLLAVVLHAPLNDVDLSANDWGVLTGIYVDKNNDEQALDSFQKGSALSATKMGSQAYIRAGMAYEHLNKPDQMAQSIQTAVKLFPDDGVVLYNLARLQNMRGQMDAAIATLQEARKDAPTYSLIYFALASIYAKKGDMTKARQALQDGLAINPDDPWLLSLKNKWMV